MDAMSSADTDKKIEGKVSLSTLAKLTGFPVEMIQEEIFKGQQSLEEISIDDLRSAMLNYLDSTMLNNND